MDGVKPCTQDTSMSVDEPIMVAHEHSDSCTDARDDIEREPSSQPFANFLADMLSSQDSEYSQAPTSGATVAVSQQPTPEFLTSLGIKVRDFAYENTLPAIVPVPRVPRQVQPALRPLKRLQRDWDDKEGPLNGSSPIRPLQGKTGSKRLKSLERKSTEPLQEPVVQHARTLERITVKRVYSIRTVPSRSAFPSTLRARLSASPPTSPLTPLPPHFSPRESEPVQPSSAFPFVMRVGGPSVIPASQLDSAPQPASQRPILYTSFTLDSRSSPDCSPSPDPPQSASPVPVISSFLELPSAAKELGVDPHVRKHCGRRTTPASNRYQLRQRPILPPRTSSLSRRLRQASNTPKALPRQSRRAR